MPTPSHIKTPGATAETDSSQKKPKNQKTNIMDPGLNSNFTNSSLDVESCMYSVATHIKFYRFVTNGILLNFLGCLGILGNIISMIILSRPQMRSSINYLLIGLALSDTLLIITSILLFGLPGIFPYSGFLFNYYYYVYAHIVPVVYPLGLMAQTASVYLTVTVSLERFVAVCHPLRARALCTYGRARAYVICIIIFSIAYNMPRLWESIIQKDFYEKMNVTVYCPRASNFRNNQLYMTIYTHWLYLIFLYLLPFMSLAFLNASIYTQVSR
ncbi:unnamed protein product [Brassicogethes aeneus]|uniref:G-protein coupled receptors family 1 profile domain-containing protein n=1 Tax=Brassicogethes aeneus TaxID=1431903 RepID=A0A9P0FLX7_BRAAE|nr:unnamed protein product [Brassicogethes aeneus]